MNKVKILGSIFLIMLISFIFYVNSNKKREEPENRKPIINSPFEVDTIRLPGGDWGYPSPYAHYPRGPGGFKMCLIFDSLLERDEKGLIPWLAVNYEIQDNGKKFLFTLRDGVKWHNGKPLTMEDVKFSLLYASKHPMTWSYIFNKIETVEITDKNKVLVIVTNPGPVMLYNLGRTRIIPRHIWEKVNVPKEFTATEAVTGCGPYRLTEYSKEHGTYRFEAFKDYWGPAQRVKTLEFIPVSESILAFEKGEIDMSGLPTDILPRFLNDTRYKIVKSPGFWGYRLLFNMGETSSLKDKKVRQAISYGIDLDELVAKIARGAAIPGSAGILPPDHVMYNPFVMSYSRNLKIAKGLLSKAGYDLLNDKGLRKNKAGKVLSFQVLCSGREVRMVQILKERLFEIGININIQSVDGKTRDARVRNHEYQMAITGHGGWGADPDYLKIRFGHDFSRSNSPSVSGLPGYNNDTLNLLFHQQHMEMNKEKRRKIVFRIQEMLAEDVPDLPLFYTTGFTVFRPEKYNGWEFMFDHHSLAHSKLSYLEKKIRK
ncbi:MAG: diguanylate phosphodiesterase [Desulfobacula sp.]|nr:diguanylate phosphodiesterase [Desulfobacula sp.]